eukprot:3049863-Lingulodinium_polyedra.AAC.1
MNPGLAAQAKYMILRRLQQDWTRRRGRRGAAAAASTDVGPGAPPGLSTTESRRYVAAIMAAMESMLSSLPDPLFADPALTSARRMSTEAFQRVAAERQRA